MSNSAKSSPTKTDATPSLQKVVIDAVPLTTIPSISPTMRRKSVAKKEKSSRTSINPSSPSSSIKKTKKKSKKSRTESRRSFTMSELHVDPLPSKDVPTPVVDTTEDDVDTSGKNSLNQNSDVPNSVENLGLEKPTVSENLGKSVPNSPVAADGNIGASTKTNNDVADESIKKTAPETHVAPSVATHGATPNVVPDVTTPLAQENLVDYSESDESPPPKATDKETVPDKAANDNPEVILVNETTTSDKAVPTNSEASVARRTRSRVNKGVETASTLAQTPKPSKAGKATGKKPVYGPPKPVSKVIPRSETKKRKAPPTSDSDFEPETDVAASGSTSRKSIGRKKVPQTVPYAPLDNVSFHLENGSARWKFVYHRRLALERNLKNDILECPSVVEALEYAGLMKTVVGLDKCYDRLVKEFLINVAADCNDPASPEYRQVFVRGKCVQFSPIVINQYLQRSSDEVAPLKATDNEICKVLTGGRIKAWPSKAKLSATSLSPFYAVLNRIAAHNWVPTTHSGDVARGLGRFIYAVGTKANFDYGAYFFQETLSHALTYAVEKPVALPTLLCNIILEQHPDILRSFDVPCKRKGVLVIEQRLLDGTNAAAGVGTSVQAGVLSRKQMIADLTETSRALEARKLKIDRVIEALKAEEAAEMAEGEPDGQEGKEASESEDGSEDVMEDSDESSSI
ncbi:unnamed protein product [Trifolium pratense]|uniref:Uncharacterized protein n=1 Tax=Trifolium pratense TaxID=57577 RepID=A0ACB0IZF4_TRIPR|nr:unnamed protein product [Trifolium pratense]